MTLEPKRDCSGCAWQYTCADETHIHKCEDCGTTWQHPQPPENISSLKAHTCPRCGSEQWYKELLSRIEKVDFPWSGEWPQAWELKENEEEDYL